MKSTRDIIDLLNQILKENEPKRMEYIISFQKYIFGDSDIKNENLNDILCDLAYDMDFYEPNEDARKKNISFYSEQHLKKLVLEAIKKIEKLSLIS